MFANTNLVLSGLIHLFCQDSFIENVRSHSLVLSGLIHLFCQDSFIEKGQVSFIENVRSHSIVLSGLVHWFCQVSFISSVRSHSLILSGLIHGTGTVSFCLYSTYTVPVLLCISLWWAQGCGSGSAWNRINFPSRIRIQEGKFVNLKLKKCKEIANNCNFLKFLKSKLAQAPFFLTFEQSFRFFTT